MIKSILITILLWNFTTLACDYTTSTTSLNSYQLEQLASQGRVTLCVDSKKFYDFQMENMLEAGINIRIYGQKVDYYDFQIENFSEAGRVFYVLGNKSYYGFQIENFLKAGTIIQFRTSKQNFNYFFEFENFAKVAKGSPGRLIILVDDNTLNDYEIARIKKAGAVIRRVR